jgi:hypothetical protein
MKPFCEIIVADILPAVRAVVAKELIEEYGLNQTEVSKKLSITQPAVSQYKRELRGTGVKILRSNKKVMSSIKKLSRKIASGKINSREIHQNFCEVCLKIRKEKIICRVHAGAHPSLAYCNICFK